MLSQPPKIKHFITESNTLLIVINDAKYYEFRDLTPRDVLWIDHLYEADREYFTNESFKESLNFLLKVLKKCLISSNSDIAKEEWSIFIEINKLVQENIMTSRLGWYDFLGFCFAAGNKSFKGIEDYMDLSLTNIIDMHDVMLDFFEQQKKMMDDAEGRVR